MTRLRCLKLLIQECHQGGPNVHLSADHQTLYPARPSRSFDRAQDKAQGSTVGQGATMGLSNSFMSLGRIAGPIWAGSIFDVNVNYPYLSDSVIMFIGFLISLAWVSQGTKETTSPGVQLASD